MLGLLGFQMAYLFKVSHTPAPEPSVPPPPRQTSKMAFQNHQIEIGISLKNELTPPISDIVPNFTVFSVTPPLRKNFKIVNPNVFHTYWVVLG